MEAARVLAQSTIQARLELLKAKTAIAEEVFAAAGTSLAATPGTAEGLRALIAEAVETLGLESVRVIVSSSEACVVRTVLEGDPELARRVTEMKDSSRSGGVIVEDPEGKLRVDNTYETRLAMLRPTLLVEIGRELLGS